MTSTQEALLEVGMSALGQKADRTSTVVIFGPFFLNFSTSAIFLPLAMLQ